MAREGYPLKKREKSSQNRILSLTDGGMNGMITVFAVQTAAGVVCAEDDERESIDYE